MGQADQAPFGPDLLQAAQAEAAEAARPLDLWPNTGSTNPLRKPYTARPRAVRNFACIFSNALADAAMLPAGNAAAWGA